MKYIILLATILLSCNSKGPAPLKTDNLDPVGPVTFAKNIQPLIRDRCAPCHIAGGDRGNKYDDYNTFKTLVTGVLGRVIKTKADPLFMPKNGEKLSEAQIGLIRKWMDQGYLE